MVSAPADHDPGSLSTAIDHPNHSYSRFITKKFRKDVTLSGNLAVNIWGWQTSTATNSRFKMDVYRLQSNGTQTLIGTYTGASELSTAASLHTGNAALSSTAFIVGDRLMVDLYFIPIGTYGNQYSYFEYDGPTASATGDSFITVTADVFTARRISTS